jgi:hypothetical protein
MYLETDLQFDKIILTTEKVKSIFIVYWQILKTNVFLIVKNLFEGL